MISRFVSQEVKRKLGTLLESFEKTVKVPVKESNKLVSRSLHVLQELGAFAFKDYLRNGIQPQLEAHAEQLAAYAEASTAAQLSCSATDIDVTYVNICKQ